MQAESAPSCPKCHRSSVNLLITSSIRTAVTSGTEHTSTTLDPSIWICMNCHTKWPNEQST